MIYLLIALSVPFYAYVLWLLAYNAYSWGFPRNVSDVFGSVFMIILAPVYMIPLFIGKHGYDLTGWHVFSKMIDIGQKVVKVIGGIE